MPMDLHKLIEAELGVNVHTRDNVTAIGTSELQVLSNNPNRVGLTLINLSNDTIYVGLDNMVSADRGIRLAANGGSVSFNWQYDMSLIAHEWHAVSTAAGNNLYVLELITL